MQRSEKDTRAGGGGNGGAKVDKWEKNVERQIKNVMTFLT
jgi:hypothetical protein